MRVEEESERVRKDEWKKKILQDYVLWAKSLAEKKAKKKKKNATRSSKSNQNKKPRYYITFSILPKK